MKIILILLVLVANNIYPQIIKDDYPISLYYIHNHTTNLKLSFNKITDFEESGILFLELPSLNFAVLQNPLNDSEMMYSLDPILWMFVTSTNLISPGEPYAYIPHFLYLGIEQFIDTKFSIPIYKGSSLIFGFDHDYLFSKKYLAVRLEGNIGIKFQVKHFSIKFFYNSQFIGYSTRYDDYNKDSIRLDISLIPENNPITHFIFNCGSEE